MQNQKMKIEENGKFKVQDVVGSSTGILIGKIDGIYAVFSYLAGRPVWTHELPVLFEKAAELIQEKHPALKTEIPPQGKPVEIPGYIKSLIGRYGLHLSLEGLYGALDTTGSHKLLEGKQVIGVKA